MELKREDLEVVLRLVTDDLGAVKMMKRNLLFDKKSFSNLFFDSQLESYNLLIAEDEELLVKILNFMEE